MKFTNARMVKLVDINDLKAEEFTDEPVHSSQFFIN